MCDSASDGMGDAPFGTNFDPGREYCPDGAEDGDGDEAEDGDGNGAGDEAGDGMRDRAEDEAGDEEGRSSERSAVQERDLKGNLGFERMPFKSQVEDLMSAASDPMEEAA